MKPAPPRQLHRAVILGALIFLSVVWLGISLGSHVGALSGQGLIALLLVLLAAAIAGVAFSWGRYRR